ncbi:DinB family protein [Metabacillus sp. 84]|uniref:DinB family protein n=1 Tax=Metabacillus sp. 84 TaxID=3404705 RepID=UPI003CEC0732
MIHSSGGINLIIRPEKHEFHPHYQPYIDLIPSGDLIMILEQQIEETLRLLEGLTEAEGVRHYASGKWTVKEVIGHIADTERIMAYRLLVICRGEQHEFRGYNDESYVKQAGFNEQTMAWHMKNLLAVRQATIMLMKGLQSSAWTLTGRANGSSVTVLALAAIIAGHERHHVKILRDRYL